MAPYLELLRVKHWIKNAAVLTALPFGWIAHGMGCSAAMLVAVAAFCLASSAIYALNDVVDREEDLLHPGKRGRPVARGAIRPVAALAQAAVLALGSLVISWTVADRSFALCVGGYLLLMAGYSVHLKQEPILDVILIACGFVLRAVAGAVAVDVYISPWLIVCTFTLCLFLGFGKRRTEVYAINHAEAAAEHRSTLSYYTPDLLNQLLSTSAGIALVTFMLYIMDTEKQPGQTVVIEKRPLLLTFPLVAYGLFRYAMLIEDGKVTGPTDILLKDRVLLVIIVLWAVASGVIIFREPIESLIGAG